MEEKKNSQIARLFAVLALAGTILVVIVAISAATGGSDDAPTKKNTPAKKQVDRPKTNKKTYEVEEGDTLTTISRNTGISIATLKRLNPDLDPQALQVGQELKLR